MTVYIFELEKWSMVNAGNGNVDWDCESVYLVLTEDKHMERWNSCNGDEDRIHQEFPDAKYTGVKMSTHERLSTTKGTVDEDCLQVFEMLPEDIQYRVNRHIGAG